MRDPIRTGTSWAWRLLAMGIVGGVVAVLMWAGVIQK